MGKRYVAIPVTWMQCAMRSSPPSSMLRPPMRTLTTHAAPLVATAGVSSSGRWQRKRSQVPIAMGRGTPLTRDVSRHVEEVYVRLGHPDLLRRCLKTGFGAFQRVVAAICAAIAVFNQGIPICRAMKLAAVMRASCSASSDACRT